MDAIDLAREEIPTLVGGAQIHNELLEKERIDDIAADMRTGIHKYINHNDIPYFGFMARKHPIDPLFGNPDKSLIPSDFDPIFDQLKDVKRTVTFPSHGIGIGTYVYNKDLTADRTALKAGIKTILRDIEAFRDKFVKEFQTPSFQLLFEAIFKRSHLDDKAQRKESMKILMSEGNPSSKVITQTELLNLMEKLKELRENQDEFFVRINNIYRQSSILFYTALYDHHLVLNAHETQISYRGMKYLKFNSKRRTKFLLECMNTVWIATKSLRALFRETLWRAENEFADLKYICYFKDSEQFPRLDLKAPDEDVNLIPSNFDPIFAPLVRIERSVTIPASSFRGVEESQVDNFFHECLKKFKLGIVAIQDKFIAEFETLANNLIQHSAASAKDINFNLLYIWERLKTLREAQEDLLLRINSIFDQSLILLQTAYRDRKLASESKDRWLYGDIINKKMSKMLGEMWLSADSIKVYVAKTLKRIENEFQAIVLRVSGDSMAFPKIKLELPKGLALEDTSFELCAICIEPLNEFLIGGDVPALRMCKNKHEFHDVCLREWLSRSRTCPTCRIVIR